MIRTCRADEQTVITHVIAVPACCPVSKNPQPGSSISISYRPIRGEVLPVEDLEPMISEYVGGLGNIRAMEEMIQDIERRCSEITSMPVRVVAKLRIAPPGGGQIQEMIVECGPIPTPPAPQETAGEAMYLICKHGGYYRPNSQGYTRSVAEAGRYTLEEAIRHTHPNGPDGPRDGMTYVPAPAHPTPAAAPTDNTALVEAAREAMKELANTSMNMPLRDWQRISSTILAALSSRPAEATSREGVDEEREDLIRTYRKLKAKLAEVEAERHNLEANKEAVTDAWHKARVRFEKAEAERDTLQAQVTEARAAGMREAATIPYDPRFGRDWLGMTAAILERADSLTPTVSDAAQEGDKP